MYIYTLVQDEIQRLSGKEMFPKLAALTDEFTQTQYEAAKLFEITYHSISNFPELAEVVSYFCKKESSQVTLRLYCCSGI